MLLARRLHRPDLHVRIGYKHLNATTPTHLCPRHTRRLHRPDLMNTTSWMHVTATNVKLQDHYSVNSRSTTDMGYTAKPNATVSGVRCVRVWVEGKGGGQAQGMYVRGNVATRAVGAMAPTTRVPCLYARRHGDAYYNTTFVPDSWYYNGNAYNHTTFTMLARGESNQ